MLKKVSQHQMLLLACKKTGFDGPEPIYVGDQTADLEAIKKQVFL